MTQSMQNSSGPAQAIRRERDTLVKGAVAKIKELTRNGISRDILENVKTELLKVSARAELFPEEDFPPVPEGQSSLYLIAEDPDHSYSFYASSPQPGRSTPPHNHTTWAVIVGVKGREHNKLYRRTDDGSRPGHGTVEVERTVDIVPGKGIALMPDDIHSIHLGDDGPHINLHVYGMSVEYVPGRVAYDTAKGTYKVFAPSKGIKK